MMKWSREDVVSAENGGNLGLGMGSSLCFATLDMSLLLSPVSLLLPFSI
ncbi:hypothetical protein SLEP1_g35738 [Rubroshorea leprosula]|uniref:Uncharacterized protein n=1 Tax=Rubroshorea leprosula TaxID=152421 RepID=A0AAV5KPQ9_9ROSI|nr:hypothetical protein SLEP1_g35738 [Rubroshorea leprosula]